MRRGILASREEIRSLSGQTARKPFDAIYDALRKRCSLILETQPVTEARWRSLWQQGYAPAALQAARATQGRILDLAIAHLVDRNAAYRDRAIEELKTLCAWSKWLDPASGDLPADLCTAEAAVAAAVGLDWLWEDLGEPDRLRVLQALRGKAVAPYKAGVKARAFWHDCYHSWNAIVNGGCGLAALALGDDEPAAMEAYHQATEGLGRFLGAIGREGGWDEGTGAWGHAMRSMLLLGEASRRLLGDRRILQARGLDATGLFPIYFTPNRQPAGFGTAPAVPLYGALYLLVRDHGLRELAWWLDSYAFREDADATNWASAGLGMLLRPVDAESPRTPDLVPLKVFHEIGWAAMADAWPHPAFWAAAKAGDLSAHGSRPDMNSVQLQVDGEMLLASAGDDPGVRAHVPQTADVNRPQTPLHNTITIAGADHAIDAQGEILEASSDKHYRWIACDSGGSCGDGVGFVRHVAMVVAPGPRGAVPTRMLVVLDELNLPSPERIDVHWHTPGAVTLKEGASAGQIRGKAASVHFALAATFDAKCSAAMPDIALPAGRGIVRLSGGAVGKARVLSVFSTRPLPGTLELKRLAAGDLRVRLPDAELHFKSRRKHMLLEKVSLR
jgi:hypothetical protein